MAKKKYFEYLEVKYRTSNLSVRERIMKAINSHLTDCNLYYRQFIGEEIPWQDIAEDFYYNHIVWMANYCMDTDRPNKHYYIQIHSTCEPHEKYIINDIATYMKDKAEATGNKKFSQPMGVYDWAKKSKRLKDHKGKGVELYHTVSDALQNFVEPVGIKHKPPFKVKLYPVRDIERVYQMVKNMI